MNSIITRNDCEEIARYIYPAHYTILKENHQQGFLKCLNELSEDRCEDEISTCKSSVCCRDVEPHFLEHQEDYCQECYGKKYGMITEEDNNIPYGYCPNRNISVADAKCETCDNFLEPSGTCYDCDEIFTCKSKFCCREVEPYLLEHQQGYCQKCYGIKYNMWY